LIEPPDHFLSKAERLASPEIAAYLHNQDIHIEDHVDPSMKADKRPFVGLISDIKRKIPWFISDFKEGFNVQCIAAAIYIYLVSLCSLVAFGALLGQNTDNYMGTIESILAGAICGILFAIFSGQPLNLLSATGPMLILENILSTLCQQYGIDFLEFRLWIGIWIGFLIFIFVLFNLSFLVKFITRFTEDCFASLVAILFIIDAFKSILKINSKYPAQIYGEEFTFKNVCNCTNTFNKSEKFINESMCESLMGDWTCFDAPIKEFVPDVFFFSILIFVFTFIICMGLKALRDSSFFPSFIRQILSDFAVLIAILSMSIMDAVLKVNTPKLIVPSELKPTRSEDRKWLIPFFEKNEYWTIFLAIAPAIIATMLIFMDQQITAVIVNRKEFKLKKGFGYHLDLLIVGITIVICSILGLPWFVAATVLALAHVNALKVLSENSAPGEKPQFVGVCEQRLTSLAVSILLGLSVFFTSVLKYIPMPVLYAVFLYMGVSTLAGLEVVDRILIILMPAKYQPDYPFLKHVNIKRVHIFTIIQVLSTTAMFTVKQIDIIAIGFPVLVVFTCFVRKILDYIFTQRELYWLDNLLPNAKIEDDKTKKVEEKDAEIVDNIRTQL
jgi:solute carrier family 4 (sodium bicarbonate cotransporter), member 7